MNENISERAQHLLKILVERYIRDGQPVGSRTLAEDTVLSLSPATIRNVLADLEERGYLTSPHTSAGRIPTVQGYRLFVDTLLTVKPINNEEVSQFKQRLNPGLGTSNLVAIASSLLSDLTKLTGLVTMPRRERSILRQIEFLFLSSNRILVILVFNDGEVQNRVIHTDKHYTHSELQQAANYLNSVYAGKDLVTIRKNILEAMREDHTQMDQLMRAAVSVAEKAFEETDSGAKDYVLAGQTHLLNLADYGGIDRLKLLFEAFAQKQSILHLLDHCLNAEGIQIFIGEESGHKAFDEMSVISAPYAVDDEIVGALAVIGPTRMPYDRVISIVDITAKLLTAALTMRRLDE